MRRQMDQRKKLIIEVVIVAVVLAITAVVGYLGDYYHATDVEDALTSDAEVSVEEIAEGYFFDGSGEDDLLIFYPGAKVEVSAYAPLMKEIAAEGIDCVLVKMPGNLAIFGKNKADDIRTAYPYTHTYLGGHSLGGAMAASYAADHTDALDGLLLLAAYSTEDLSGSGLTVVSLVGTEDGVINRDKLAEYAPNLPTDASVITIDGGNHANYASYGDQDGDGEATITGEEQREAVVEAVARAFLD